MCVQESELSPTDRAHATTVNFQKSSFCGEEALWDTGDGDGGRCCCRKHKFHDGIIFIARQHTDARY